ncbi:right-handed parallel beta-helix repeat-containing protein [Aeribacillus pallidus]|uniref:right-handed parallel beta-helix repeat-containing protein n=1 Tax=Aeribacillus pallidus TaxID=33936 RepID=UPI003D195354
MATFTTGPVVTDRAVLSLVVQIQNDTNSTVPVTINIYDLSTCPKTVHNTTTLNVENNSSEFTIFPRPPIRFEVEIVGLVDNMFAWIGGRNVTPITALNIGSFLVQNIFSNQDLVEVEEIPSPGISTLTTGPVVVSTRPGSTIVEVLNNTTSGQVVTVNIYDLATTPKTLQHTATLNIAPNCSVNQIFPQPPTRYEVEFVNMADGVLAWTANRSQVQSVALKDSGFIPQNEFRHAQLSQVLNLELAAVNAAQDITEMRAAIEDPLLGLDLTAYNALTVLQQDEVLQGLLDNRPASGYPTVSSVQDALNNEINQIVDPNNIYVMAGSVGGDGSRANPFGTIPQGIAAVNVGGTVHILEGTYPITAQINVNKSGITLLGESDPLLLLQANVIPLLVSASDVTIDGLTITSDVPYAKEFIQVGGANVSLVNNTIYGPPQPGPMSGWIVNRAVVSQNNISNILLENNTFYSLRTGMYINPNTTGQINNNVVYNTKGGFLVDRAFTTFDGNSWGVPPNEFDIVLLAGTTMGPPYDDIPALQAANNNATISDQR